ncbi:MAG TPA: CocE/NonD family hydrolase, partial [Bacteroidia bacterium]|nr:CocE/NonD family hydrolase [Bacteroidia bacterium]
MMYPYQSPDSGRYQKVKRRSLYLTMRDGVELAVDVWLPKGLAINQQLPCLLHQTRYWRGAELRWPFSALSDGLLGHEGKMVRELVLNGFAFVNVDCRGSGASFGSRKHPWSPDEVQDGHEVADWIVQQPWSNQIIGTVGISYTGTTAEFARSLAHPAIKASMPLFSLYDIFDDIAMPGGIPHDGFVIEWGRANASLDKNVIPVKDPLIKLLVKGVSPVGKGKDAQARLQAALGEHQQNLGVHETSSGIDFRDQEPQNKIVRSMDDFSPHQHQTAGDRSNTALLGLSGWRDGAYPHASIRRYLNTGASVNRLILGPWDHGGKNHITPGKARKLGLEIASEAIKFFDHYLKGYDTGIDRQHPVQYYTMQAEQWRGCEAWPPPGAVQTPHYLLPGKSLQTEAPSQADMQLLVHNPAQGTGHYTRWRGLRMTLGTGKLYPDRNKRDELLACFDSAPLANAVEVTGHGEARLFIRTEEPDGSFFVYLEDITPGGEVWYVTEGELRALHRKVSTAPPPYRDAIAYHSYLREDAAAIPPGEVVEVIFDLLPVSYLFKKGHR